jgi:hypothetical protein
MLILLGASGYARTQDAKAPASASVRTEKLKKLYRLFEYEDRVRADLRTSILKALRDDAAKADAALAKVKWDSVEGFFVTELDRRVDDRTLDEVLPFLETPEGKKTLALLRLNRALLPLDLLLAIGDRGGGLDSLLADYEKVLDKAVEEASPEATPETNEVVAIATLRNLASCQAQIQTSGKIDCDADGIGEYGTFLELTGSVGVRQALVPGDIAGSDFSTQGTAVNPPILSPALANVDPNGIVTRKGYCFRIFLPDTTPRPYGCTYETGPAERVGLAGGTGKVGVDMSEMTWCAYAWPVRRGGTGNRVFFVSQMGDVLQSSNEVAKWEGAERAPDWKSALVGPGLIAPAAEGTKGNDGDLWTFTR